MKFDNVFKLILINFFNHLYFFNAIATFIYLQKGLNLFQIVSLEAVLVLFILFGEVPTGMFADRYGRKTSIIAYCLVLLISEIIFLFGQGFWMLALSSAFAGLALSFYSGAGEALLYDSLKEERKQHLMKKYMGTIGASTLAAYIIASVSGSIIGADLSMKSFMLLIQMVIIAVIIGTLFSLTLKEPKYKEKNKELNPFKSFSDGIKQIKSNPSLLRIIMLSIFAAPFFHVITLLYQPYLKSLGISVVWLGTILAISFVLSALASKYAYKIEEKLGVSRGILFVTLTPGILYIILALLKNPLIATAAFIAIVAVSGFGEPLFSHYRNVHIKSFNRATVLSIISLLGALYETTARPTIGWIANTNINWAFLAMGTIIITAALLIRLKPEHVKHKTGF
jgi:MFS family permease